MSDDEYDDELPSISVNTSTCEDIQFTMPSADVLASQRAREEECEQELRQLRSQYESLPITRLSPHDSSGSDGEAALAAAVDTLRMQPVASPYHQQEATDILRILISNLPDYDTSFLKDYLEVLQKEDISTVGSVTDSVMDSVEDILQLVGSGRASLGEQERVVLGAWLSAAAAARPRPRARRALHALLARLSDTQTRALVSAWAGAPAAALLAASDAARAPHCSRRLAAPLLRAALARLLPTQRPAHAHAQDAGAPLSAAELAGALAPAWRTMPAAARYTAVQLAGRVLASAAGRPADGAGRLLALLATAPPAAARLQPDHLKVMVAVSKLQVLFRDKT